MTTALCLFGIARPQSHYSALCEFNRKQNGAPPTFEHPRAFIYFRTQSSCEDPCSTFRVNPLMSPIGKVPDLRREARQYHIKRVVNSATVTFYASRSNTRAQFISELCDISILPHHVAVFGHTSTSICIDLLRSSAIQYPISYAVRNFPLFCVTVSVSLLCGYLIPQQQYYHLV